MSLFSKDKTVKDVWTPESGKPSEFSAPPPVSPSAASAARLTSLRSALGTPRDDAPEAAPDPAPRQPTELPPDALIVIRNCSTKRVLQQLLGELGGKPEEISGRYFIPEAQDLEKIHKYAESNGFFVKESLVRNVMVLDLMVDRARRGGFGRHGSYGADLEDTL